MRDQPAAGACKAPSANFPQAVLERLRGISDMQQQAQSRLREVLDRNHGPGPSSGSDASLLNGASSMFADVHGMLSVLWDQAVELRNLGDTLNETH